MAPCRSAADATSLTGTYRNSASGSTNLLISHGHAIRSTLAFFRVTHLISSTPVVGMSSSSILLRMTVMLQDLSVAIQVFFFQAEDGIRDLTVTGVQTCALPI